MGLYPGSIFNLTNADAAVVAMVDGTGTQLTGFDPSRPATATLSSVAASVTSVLLLAANAARRRFVIHNQSSSVLFVAFAATATAAAYTYRIAANSDIDGALNDYTGIITGIWAAANGNARITEITT